MAQIRRLAAEGLGVLFTTHDPNQALRYADRVMLLLDGSKYARHGLIHVCGWPSVNVFVSDVPPPEGIKLALDHAEVVVAS